MNPDNIDEALVDEAKAGSTGAFARLVERHQQPLRAFLRRTCGDWAAADDLAQETFLTAWSRIGKLQAGASVRAWLCGIGYHKHLSAVRSAGRARARDRAWQAEEAPLSGAMTDERLTLEAALSRAAARPARLRGAVPGGRLQPRGGGRGPRPSARHREEPCDAAAARGCSKFWESPTMDADARLKALFAQDEPPARDPVFSAAVMAEVVRRRFLADMALLGAAAAAGGFAALDLLAAALAPRDHLRRGPGPGGGGPGGGGHGGRGPRRAPPPGPGPES